MKKNIFIAGHQGMVGSAIAKRLSKENCNLITKNKAELNLVNQKEVDKFFLNNKIDQIYIAAARVGGIKANNEYPADFIYQNLMIQNNLINSAHKFNIEKLLFLGSSCIYPKFSKQPINENMLMTGKLEETNEPYAIAKIAGIKMCESYNRQFGTDFRCVMPTNLYGPGDNFDLNNSHVIPALIRKFYEAKMKSKNEVEVWGTGSAKREFLHVDDMADACIFIMEMQKDTYRQSTELQSSHVNIGTGVDISIRDLSDLIAKMIEYEGSVVFNSNEKEGTPKKVLDISLLQKLGWKSKISLEDGLKKTVEWYKNNQDLIRN